MKKKPKKRRCRSIGGYGDGTYMHERRTVPIRCTLRQGHRGQHSATAMFDHVCQSFDWNRGR